MRRKLKKCTILIAVFLFVVLCFSGCSSKSEIEGYWVSGDEKYSVSFDGDGTIVVDDKYIGEYNIFDDNKIAINVDTPTFDEYLDLSMSATYMIENDMLSITDKEKGLEFRFYTKEKVETIINREYKEKSTNYIGIKSFSSPKHLGYFDDNGNLIRSFDWIIDESDETLYENVEKVRDLFCEEVLAFYQTKSPDGKYQVLDNGLFGVGTEGTLLYGIELRREGNETISLVNRYAIEPVEGLIYVQEDVVEDSYELWDGTVAYGKSLLDN